MSTGVFGWVRTVGAVDKVDSGFAVSASRPLQLSATKPNLSLDISTYQLCPGSPFFTAIADAASAGHARAATT